ncbi:hypothetical protein CLAFUW4_10630 [Fulvia fulva]|uniref:Uncharacterized protein n=1 Tax=Passalora fulva TaxID=5499 RepID=A0A9Q8LF28_PASFU|nr:uncharacterized protein CLAFUR5_05243 [Fulvia fulva]KAK4615532.1 hypothetical protein CLAFUR4_10635 [Fulvia fulva]KAK4617376.1 hypothetical protein CLAFUR0_10609 [Fulvia fulva]UJO16267.1 hypothetical protein CLAFUR5_05243 [Fulvia fulva]WPV18897.1 hypothetical protein CLAFUW4_10630 [Fulvia fulva]WPV34497.1 hypothetical protein CLAFUW7_10632 [Fulvia fulva]
MCQEQLFQREGRSRRLHERFLTDAEWDNPRITGPWQPGHSDPNVAAILFAQMGAEDETEDEVQEMTSPDPSVESDDAVDANNGVQPLVNWGTFIMAPLHVPEDHTQNTGDAVTDDTGSDHDSSSGDHDHGERLSQLDLGPPMMPTIEPFEAESNSGISDISSLDLGPPLVPLPTLTFQDLLDRMNDLRQSLEHHEAARQEVMNLTDDESSGDDSSDDLSATGDDEGGASDALDDNRSGTSDEGDEEDSGIESTGETFWELMVSAHIYHNPTLHAAWSVWEEGVRNLRCPHCDGDIYSGCAEWCDRPYEDYEVLEGQL